MSEPQIVATVQNVIHETGISPGSLKLEITETMIMDNQHDLTPVLHALRKSGIVLCMDDFGTGHSSLSCLHRFPIDVLKIDPQVETRQRARLARLRETRDPARVDSALAALEAAARGSANLVPHLLECALLYCTLYEIRHALERVFGSYREAVSF
mgnify:CR=1 FL=1